MSYALRRLLSAGALITAAAASIATSRSDGCEVEPVGPPPIPSGAVQAAAGDAAPAMEREARGWVIRASVAAPEDVLGSELVVHLYAAHLHGAPELIAAVLSPQGEVIDEIVAPVTPELGEVRLVAPELFASCFDRPETRDGERCDVELYFDVEVHGRGAADVAFDAVATVHVAGDETPIAEPGLVVTVEPIGVTVEVPPEGDEPEGEDEGDEAPPRGDAEGETGSEDGEADA